VKFKPQDSYEPGYCLCIEILSTPMHQTLRHCFFPGLAAAIFLTATARLDAVEPSRFTPSIYAFQNGLGSLTPDEGARLLKKIGYAGIGSVYPKDANQYLAACKAEGLKIFSIYAGGKVDETAYRIDTHVREAIVSLRGTDALVELNLQRGDNPNDGQAVAMVREVADLAKKSGLKVVIYPHDKFYVENLDHAVRIAWASGRDNVGVTFNLCHFLKVQPKADLEAVLENAKPVLWSASVCGADADGKDWPTLIQPLDEGSFDQASLLQHLAKIEFKGPIGLQCFNIRIEPRQHLTRSYIAWQKHLTASQGGSKS